jgi:hypothetical protein
VFFAEPLIKAWHYDALALLPSTGTREKIKFYQEPKSWLLVFFCNQKAPPSGISAELFYFSSRYHFPLGKVLIPSMRKKRWRRSSPPKMASWEIGAMAQAIPLLWRTR